MDYIIGENGYTLKAFYRTFCSSLPKIISVSQGFYGERLLETLDRGEEEVHMDYIIGEKGYTLKEFYRTFCSSLPQIISVSQGFYGERLLETLDRGEHVTLDTLLYQFTPKILWISHVLTETRVVAMVLDGNRALLGKIITIPVNHPSKFHLESKKNKVRREVISSLLKHHTLPFTVRYTGEQLEIGSSLHAGQYLRLELRHLHEEVYLMGHTISNCRVWLGIRAIPLYLTDVVVSIVKGAKNITEEEWTMFLRHITKILQTNEIKEHSDSCTGIAVYEKRGSETREEISTTAPSEYCTIESIGDMHHYSPLMKLERPTDDANVYDFIPSHYEKHDISENDETKRPKKPPKIPPKPQKQRKETGNTQHTPPALPGRKVSKKEEFSGSPRNKPEVRESDMRSFSIDDVCEALRLLSLDTYVRRFRDARIDGVILNDLNEDILHEELGMKRYEAIKLINYVKIRHIPS